ncbi:hypothetical protein BBJ29_000476 [Phytophthora kernoviae]|uniref:Amidohydrolase-related domain-containing protein n=1 Tax=Phytophthora kernoviae TaxID=325452 RepID=A0A3F2RT38_9STRA|nr:hypothetical protein BBJ29_000476 [Phytophthora kernoviae]RLN63740.1 hypothetical protein BBP00_00003914 [Phytophthora kernoviae]
MIRYVRGRVVHAPLRGEIELFEDAFLTIDSATGRIICFHAQTQPEDLVLAATSSFLKLSSDEFLMPGFVDTHVHAPQFQFMGTATDVPLMQWLDRYTFRVEQSFQDVAVATEWYTKLLDCMLAEGITTAQYFATIHVEATKKLADLVETRGQRGLVGLVSMDRNAPETYVSSSTEQCLEDAEEFVKYVLEKKSELVKPVVTPRFVPTCSLELLRGLGALAAKYDVHVQSHIAESLDEEAFVESLHPGRHSELDVMHRTGASIAHCPLSNFFFANGLLDVRKIFDKKVDIGLGTDIAGGYSPSMIRAIQTSVLTIKALEIRDGTSSSPTKPFDYKDAFWLATMGGAKALAIENDIGSFAVGKSFDAILVDVSLGKNLVVSDRDTSMDIFQKIIHNADSRNFAKVFVKGRVVHAIT